MQSNPDVLFLASKPELLALSRTFEKADPLAVGPALVHVPISSKWPGSCLEDSSSILKRLFASFPPVDSVVDGGHMHPRACTVHDPTSLLLAD